jgi:hypothetical protein
MIKEVSAYIFRYAPWDASFPIRSCELTIIAGDRKEAELIALSNGHKFFDQDCTCVVTKVRDGYQQVEEDK